MTTKRSDPRTIDWFLLARLAFAAGGIAVGGWGVRLLLNYPSPVLISLGTWLLAAVIIHDGVLSPLVLGIGALVGRLPARGRRFVQFFLIAGFPSIVIAIPMIINQGTFPPVKALLEQQYQWNLALILGLIGAGVLVAYAITVARSRPHRARRTP